MEIIKFNKLQIELTPKQLDFSMVVQPGAAYCPEVTDFYIKALVDKTDAALFLNVPGNKASKRIPILTTGRVIQPFNCTWNGKDVDLNGKEVAVDKVSVMTQICISDIEDSFDVWNMTSGANNAVNPQALLSYIWSEIARQARADVEYLRWYGNKSVTDVTGFTDRTNGYITLLKSNVGLVNIVPSPLVITPANVVAEMYKSLALVDPIQRVDFKNLSIFVSSNVALAFAVAQNNGNNTATHLVDDKGTIFLGRYTITEVATLEDNIILISPKQDIIFTYDLDNENFMTVDMSTTSAEPVVRFRVNMYFGFDFYDYSNVVYYGPSLS